jgi:hypothetical protein
MAYIGGHLTEQDIVWFMLTDSDVLVKYLDNVDKACQHIHKCRGCANRYSEAINRFAHQSELGEKNHEEEL